MTKRSTTLKIKDLQKAARSLKKLVAKQLKLKKHDVQITDTFLRRRCFIRYHFKGDPLKLKEPLKDKGFKIEVASVADEKVVRCTKTFEYRGLLHTARLAIVPGMNRLTLSISTEPPPAPF